MSKETKDKLLAKIHFDTMIEDIVYMAGSHHRLVEEDVLTIIDDLYEEDAPEEVLYASFKDVFKRRDRLEKYIELQDLALQAQENFIEYLDRKLAVQINKHLPEDKQIPEEKIH